MGVPKFFRWLSERYPCLCEELKEYQIPEMDNFYLDMNGIIHVCSHPNDFDPHFRITEEQIFFNIFHYIEVLFRLIRPQKLFFMAVDGVAPRAKMNQQRGRRFSSAKEAENLEKKALEKGESLPSEKRFDSNCITPGTKFMAKLQEQLKYFVARKISTDKLWQKPTVILSGHSVPGEGEHKIMDYIRYLRSKPDWDPYTRHCLYGLDADLIILGLCTHEPNFCILREEVRYVKTAKNKRTATPETTNYNLLHLSLLRGYIDLEFHSLKNKLPFPFDIEKIIDDWVLMGFLVGNDFIPHLPHWHIHKNALEILYNAYKAVLPSFDGYINENGNLNLERFEKFLIELSKIDMDTFNDTYADMKYFESKTGRKLFPEMEPEQGDKHLISKVDEAALHALIKSSELEMFDFGDDCDDLDEAIEQEGLETLTIDDEENKLMFKEFKNHKRVYYLEKMKYPSVSEDVLKKEAEVYVLALQWILFYYYKGCPSWCWYYPHHYSPYVSDLKNFSSLDVKFTPGKPFLPFQQLLAVLPAASREFLPNVYQQLMTAQESPIIDYYPTDFKSDLNGKRQEWEAVVLIPFIEEKRLIDAMEPFNDSLSEEERFRNSHGPMQMYQYCQKSLGSYKSPEYFLEVTSNHAKCMELYPSDVAVPKDKLVTGKHPALADATNVYMPGFPSLSTLQITGTLEKKGVKVFDYPSRGDNMILRIQSRKEFSKSIEEIFNDIMAKDFVYVSYPHLTAARVRMLSSQMTTVKLSKDDKVLVQPNDSLAQSNWQRKMNQLKEVYMNKFGIDVSKCNFILHANPLEGTKIGFSSQGYGFCNMIWGSSENAYPLDTCLVEVTQREQEKIKMNKHIPLETIFPPGAIAYSLAPAGYGSKVEVKEVVDKQILLIELFKTPEPDLVDVRNEIKSSSTMYLPGYACAQRLAMSSHLFSRVTSGIIVQSPHTDSDKTNIGLNLKFSKSDKQMVGFTKKMDKKWFYSNNTIEMVRSYMEKFPDLFTYLANNTNEDIFFKDKMFPDEESASQLNEIRTWLKGLEKGELRSVSSELLEPNVVKTLENVIDQYEEDDLLLEIMTIRLKPHYLHLPRPDLIVAAPDPEAVHLILDRIVYVRECHSIPLGLKGTIIGFEKKPRSIACEDSDWEEAATLYDILFDQEVIGGQALFGCKSKRVYRLTKQVFINISYGERKHRLSQYPGKELERPKSKNQTENKNLQELTSWRMSSTNQPNSTNQNSDKAIQPKQHAQQAPFNNASQFSGVASPSGKELERPKSKNQTENKNLQELTSWRVSTTNQPNSTNQNSDKAIPPKQHAQQAPFNNASQFSGVTRPSGSVSNFFNAYRNSVNTFPEDKPLQQTPSAPIPKHNTPPNLPIQSPSNDPAYLSDMWNLLKSLQNQSISPEQCDSDGNQIPSQTYVRSNVLSNVPSYPQQMPKFAIGKPHPLPMQHVNKQQVLHKQPFIMPQQLPTQQLNPLPGQQLLQQPLQQLLQQPLQQSMNQQTTPRDSRPAGGVNPVRNNNAPVTGLTTPAQVPNPFQFVEQTEALKKMLCIAPGRLNQGSLNAENNNLDNTNQRGNQRNSDIRPLLEIETDTNKTKRWSAPVLNSPEMKYPGGNQSGSGSKNCGHLPSCMSYFLNLCSLYKMEEPYFWLNVSEWEDGLIAFCRLSDGFQFSGPIRENTELAREAMACSGINILHERFGSLTEINDAKKNRRHVLSGYQQAQNAAIQAKPIKNHTARINNFTPPQMSALPNKTVTTCPSNLSAKSSQKESSAHDTTQLQHQYQSSSAKQDVDRNEDGNKKKRNRRKMRIAANFHNPISPN